MLVHFIGGPAHGRSEAVERPPSQIRVPRLAEERSFAEDAIPPFPSTVRVETLSYKITRRTRRYCIAEFEEPKVPVDFRVTLGVGPYDYAAMQELDRVLLEWREEKPSGSVHLLSMERHRFDEVDMTFGVTVDGPADAMALAEAGETLQHFLDARLPVAVRRSIRHIGSQGSVNP